MQPLAMHDLCFMYDMMSYITLLLGSLSPESALYYKDYRRRKVRKAFTCMATYL